MTLDTPNDLTPGTKHFIGASNGSTPEGLKNDASAKPKTAGNDKK
jgi:hypothetical protein